MREDLAMPSVEQLADVRRYVARSWSVLTRSHESLIAALTDPKVEAEDKPTIHIAANEDEERIRGEFYRAAEVVRSVGINIERVPDDVSQVDDGGLLYLPHPYVVPGGRFNEMYGWDSYFTVVGLIRDGQIELAKAMTDNCLYQIEYYGKVLNANRLYYLTRSQPPLVTEMVLEVFRQTEDIAWLASTLPTIKKYHSFWMSDPRYIWQNGLSRYHGGVATPAAEVMFGEQDEDGKDHYQRVIEYYQRHAIDEYKVDRYYDAENDCLRPEFYVADRAMRESGFDCSSRFGPFSAGILDYNPVDLNCLLMRMEQEIGSILSILGESGEASLWHEKASRRSDTINALMWNDQAGMYFDYNFREGRQSTYEFVTAFYPLWVGAADPDQAAALVANLPVFESLGGLQTSPRVSGNQWDAPFGWAPLHMIAVEGLRRYGYHVEADRISRKFLSMVVNDFTRTGVIKEKYDVVHATSDLDGRVKFGYSSNEIGFGWTNAAVVVFHDQLVTRRDPAWLTGGVAAEAVVA